jgi:hypothetical protein
MFVIILGADYFYLNKLVLKKARAVLGMGLKLKCNLN